MLHLPLSLWFSDDGRGGFSPLDRLHHGKGKGGRRFDVRIVVDIVPHTHTHTIQPADIGWPTGNGKKLSNSQACCLAQLCLAAA